MNIELMQCCINKYYLRKIYSITHPILKEQSQNNSRILLISFVNLFSLIEVPSLELKLKLISKLKVYQLISLCVFYDFLSSCKINNFFDSSI